jgi:hypothetical protein
VRASLGPSSNGRVALEEPQCLLAERNWYDQGSTADREHQTMLG